MGWPEGVVDGLHPAATDADERAASARSNGRAEIPDGLVQSRIRRATWPASRAALSA